MKQIQIVNKIAEEMVGIGGIPTNKEFYEEFNMALTSKLNIKTECNWKSADVGMFGCPDKVYITDCGNEYDCDKTIKSNFCPNCGCSVS